MTLCLHTAISTQPLVVEVSFLSYSSVMTLFLKPSPLWHCLLHSAFTTLPSGWLSRCSWRRRHDAAFMTLPTRRSLHDAAFTMLQLLCCLYVGTFTTLPSWSCLCNAAFLTLPLRGWANSNSWTKDLLLCPRNREQTIPRPWPVGTCLPAQWNLAMNSTWLLFPIRCLDLSYQHNWFSPPPPPLSWLRDWSADTAAASWICQSRQCQPATAKHWPLKIPVFLTGRDHTAALCIVRVMNVLRTDDTAFFLKVQSLCIRVCSGLSES